MKEAIIIKFEYNSLVLDQSHTKEDQKAINDFIEYKLREYEKEMLAKFSGNLKDHS